MRKRVGCVAALGLALCASVLLGPPPASAEWHAVGSPDGISRIAVADADTWLIEPPGSCCTFQLTGDQGGHWETVQIEGFYNATLVGAAADGSFRVLASRPGAAAPREFQVFGIAPGGDAEPLGPAIESETVFFSSEMAVSDEGVTWVPFRDPGSNFRLALVGADGSSSIVTPPSGPTPTTEWRAVRTALGMRLLRHAADGSFPSVFARETFRLEDGDFVAAEPHPVAFVDGELLVGSDGAMSWDGGVHWASERVVNPVPRAPGLGNPRYLTPPGGGIAERFSAFLFHKTGLVWPSGVPVNYVVDAGRALIAWSGDSIHIHEGPLPPQSRAIGDLAPDAQAMIARADLFRADAGLPPLTGSARISQAARNHAHYLVLNPEAEESAHYETPGEPGFTGATLLDRCAAVGTNCNSEIASPPGDPDHVGGWLATPFHRPLIAAPVAGIVGAGLEGGGWAIMNASGEEQNVLVRPFGYPNGRWRGPDGFPGERPDPVEVCRGLGQPIEYPVGIAVTLFVPADYVWNDAKVTSIEVREEGSSSPLRGCLIDDSDPYGNTMGAFVLDDPLVEGKTYRARGEWYTGSDRSPTGVATPGTTLIHEWSFTHLPDGVGAASGHGTRRRCAGVHLRRAWPYRARSGKGRGRSKAVGAVLALRGPARVRIRGARLAYRSGKRRRQAKLRLTAVRRRTFHVNRRSFLRLRLPRRLARNLPVGRPVRLSLVLMATPARGSCRSGRQLRVRVSTPVVLMPRRGAPFGPARRGTPS